MNQFIDHHSVDFTNFEAEILETQNALLAATADLTSPLGDLVRAQIKRAYPPIRAAVVLAVAGVAEDEESRRKRILLASALEMLHVALNVHRLLINAAMNEHNSNAPLDRSFVGSTILAGDYCFSRAAQMAAQTDHPRVVSIFALALQNVSERLLREQFIQGNDPAQAATSDAKSKYDETHELLHSGSQAAAALVDLSDAEQQEAIHLSEELATRWTHGAPGLIAGDGQINKWAETLPISWQALYHWLVHQ
jgi:geranylgeranyl pyrophosphate synthase